MVSRHSTGSLTRVFGLRDDFAEQFSEVREIFSEELGFEDQRLSRMVCQQLASQHLGLAYDSKAGAPLGVLDPAWLGGVSIGLNGELP